MRARREKHLNQGLVAFSALSIEMRERSRFRRELNASDAPDPVKTVLGLLIDPVGYAVDMIGKMAQEGKLDLEKAGEKP
jgi:hypothetical protein